MANIYLGMLMLSFSLYVLEFALYYTNFFYNYPALVFVTVSFPLLFGPLLFFYVSELSHSPNRPGVQTLLIHLIPFLAYILYLLPEYFSSSDEKLNVFINSIRSSEPHFSYLFYPIEVFKLIQLLIYVGLTIALVKKTSSLKPIHYQWVQLLIAGFILYAIFDGLHAFELYYFGYQNIALLGNLLFILGAGLIYYIGYKSLQRPELLVGKLGRLTNSIAYSKSTLTEAQAKTIRDKLTHLVEQEQIFLEDTISLPSLAQKLQTTTHILSQVLNEQMGMNFFDFINSHRITEAKKRLISSQYKHLSIEGIAFDVGFKTKTSFNTAFNKFVGTTPSKFRARQLGDLV